MKPQFAFGGIAFFLTGILTLAPVKAQDTKPSVAMAHMPMQALHNPDGSFRRS